MYINIITLIEGLGGDDIYNQFISYCVITSDMLRSEARSATLGTRLSI
jgi:hypothetical protein